MIAELVYIILGLAILWLSLTIIWDGREHRARMRMLKKRESGTKNELARKTRQHQGRGCMTAKEYLWQYGQLKREVLRLLEERQRWVDLATRITPTYSDVPVSGQSGDGKIPAAVEKIVEQERRIDAKIAEMTKLLDEIEKLLGEVGNPDYRLLLELRYLQGLTWEQIAKKMHYSWRHIIRLHGKALLQMRDVMVCHTPPVL